MDERVSHPLPQRPPRCSLEIGEEICRDHVDLRSF